METILVYVLKMFFCSGVMFLYYQLFLRDKTFHHYNRFYLIALLVISLVLPLLKIDFFTIEVSPNIYKLFSQVQHINNTKISSDAINYYQFILYAIGLVSFFFLGRLIFGVFKIFRLSKSYQEEEFHGIKFYQTNLSEAPFSFFRNLFWKESIVLNSDLGKQILKHEMVHIEQKHSFDKLGSELIVSVFWFNPIFHIVKKEISLIHEYLADQKSVKNSDTQSFAKMLLASHFSGTVLPATSPFLSSNLKKRLKMLQKPTTQYSYLRRLLALPTVFLLVFAYLVNAKNTEIKQLNNLVNESHHEKIDDTIQIEKQVEELKKTIPETSKKVVKTGDEFAKINKELSAKAKEIAQLAKEKKVDTPEFQLKEKELDALANKVNKMVDSPEFKEHLKKIENSSNAMHGFFDSPTFRNHIKSLSKNAEYFNSLEFQKRIREFEEKSNLNSEGRMLFFNKKDLDSLMKGVKLSELQAKALKKYSEINERKAKELAANAKELESKSKEVKKLYTQQGYSFDSYFAPNNQLSKKEKRKLEELNKKQNELRKKQAKLSKEKAEILKNDFSRSLGLEPMDIKIFPKGNLTLATSGKSVDNVRVFVDGKEIDKDAMNKIDPKTIEKININKSSNDGVSSGEIHIKLK